MDIGIARDRRQGDRLLITAAQTLDDLRQPTRATHAVAARLARRVGQQIEQQPLDRQRAGEAAGHQLAAQAERGAQRNRALELARRLVAELGQVGERRVARELDHQQPRSGGAEGVFVLEARRMAGERERPMVERHRSAALAVRAGEQQRDHEALVGMGREGVRAAAVKLRDPHRPTRADVVGRVVEGAPRDLLDAARRGIRGH